MRLEGAKATNAPPGYSFLVLKTSGYLVSTLSVFLLGAVSLKSATDNPALTFALLAGMGTSIAGMFLRWLAYRQEQREKTRERKTVAGARGRAA